MELTLLREQDATTLWDFETQHRTYFESWIRPRPETFYTPHGFDTALQAALLEQATGHAFHYLAWVGGELVGRISLLQVQRHPVPSATLHYRIAPQHSGQGLASQAVQLVMQKAFHTHGLQRLDASAHPDNPASVRVLLKNGFQPHGHSLARPQLHRQWLDWQYFEACAPAAPVHRSDAGDGTRTRTALARSRQHSGTMPRKK